jgi:tripartite-type tricarboxylate transporter receptor subunit TctC
VTGLSRWPELPNVPTMVEAGYPDFVFDTFTALLAPAKTPPEIVSLLEKESLAILARADMRKKLTEAGFEVQAKDGRAFMTRVDREVPMFRAVIKQAGIQQQ